MPLVVRFLIRRYRKPHLKQIFNKITSHLKQVVAALPLSLSLTSDKSRPIRLKPSKERHLRESAKVQAFISHDPTRRYFRVRHNRIRSHWNSSPIPRF
ncbi:hypothetical protein CEXT_712631 [Caerostris extrusa]|uniref:Uncharacterized protein n=1 Tax=Caerostris extrusa TaxID=172846 RepID=A0AAV4Y9G5_CAEEX|nr:hypothetical protein CEXT_712631 [Caerostris extrusa]